jgi:hypothetical protein
MKKKIHINQHVIRSNKKNGTNDPVITVKTSKSNTYANEVEIFGKSKLVYSPIKPLPCGAKVWILPNGEFYDISGMQLMENKLFGVRETHRLVITIEKEKWRMGQVLKKL